MGTTRFTKGQTVRSTVTAQGLTAGAVYTVVDIMALAVAFGGEFITYVLDDGVAMRPVTNGHLLLEEVTVRCPGEAHRPEVGGMIDYCSVCAPRWGWVEVASTDPMHHTCPTRFCNARPGQRCITGNGMSKKTVHPARAAKAVRS